MLYVNYYFLNMSFLHYGFFISISHDRPDETPSALRPPSADETWHVTPTAMPIDFLLSCDTHCKHDYRKTSIIIIKLY